jgi:hypothetical protein
VEQGVVPQASTTPAGQDTLSVRGEYTVAPLPTNSYCRMMVAEAAGRKTITARKEVLKWGWVEIWAENPVNLSG